MVLANILRTDADRHRLLPDDSEPVQAIAVLARARQDAVADRTRAHNRLLGQRQLDRVKHLARHRQTRRLVMRAHDRGIHAHHLQTHPPTRSGLRDQPAHQPLELPGRRPRTKTGVHTADQGT
jgi:hypothetical protein